MKPPLHILALAALAAPFALAACTNNTVPTTPAATTELSNPTLTAIPAKTDPLAGALFDSPAWRNAYWLPLTQAIKETRTVPATKVASVFDGERLYVAVVGVEAAFGASAVSVWLDTSKAQNGTEMFEIIANVGETQIRSNWHRCVNPPETRDTPDLSLPMSHFPDTPVANLSVKAGTAFLDGKKAWTLVFSIPLQSLPGPLRAQLPSPTAKAGETKWRINLLRQDAVVGQDKSRDVVQANLSPVYTGAQAVMPYRMAMLVLANNATRAVAVR